MEGEQSQLPELSLHPGWLSPAASIAPPPLIDFWFLRAVTPLQLFHNPAAVSKQKGKVATGRMSGFQKKKMLLASVSLEQKREDGAAAVTLVAGRVVNCRWNQ